MGLLYLFVNISRLLHTKCLALTHVGDGKFVHVTEKWVKFIMLQEIILMIILSIQKRQNLNPEKKIKRSIKFKPRNL
jgi:hypothetical protein